MATQMKKPSKNATGTTDVNVNSLIPYAGNSKLHPDWHVEQIAASIHRFGFVAPIVVDEDNMILAGHGRAMAAKKLGIEMVPVVVKTGLSKAEKQAYIIADNRLTTVTDFDEETLAAELKCIMESGEFDDLELIGFTDDELEELLGSEDEDGDKKDVTPPPRSRRFHPDRRHLPHRPSFFSVWRQHRRGSLKSFGRVGEG